MEVGAALLTRPTLATVSPHTSAPHPLSQPIYFTLRSCQAIWVHNRDGVMMAARRHVTLAGSNENVHFLFQFEY